MLFSAERLAPRRSATGVGVQGLRMRTPLALLGGGYPRRGRGFMEKTLEVESDWRALPEVLKVYAQRV